ncbi:MAG: ATP-binding cassette domain-containing protein [Bacteroidales bacterium]
MAIIIENIAKSFGEIKALEQVSFSIPDGEIFGLIGPDGAGKTTLFRIIVTLLLPDHGTATVLGLDTRKDFREIRKRMGYMAGRFSLYHDLTVKENMQFYATVFGTTIEKNYDLIRDIYSHIQPFENRLAGRLSGGMKQKLALSCALIHRPEVLVLDEPTTGVDAVSRSEFWEMLKKIRAEGITVVVSTPYMDEAAMCDRVGLIQQGKLLSVNDPASLEMEQGTTLWNFKSGGNIYEHLKLIRGVSESISAWLFGDEIHVVTSDKADEVKLSDFYKNRNVPDLRLRKMKPGVEDYFMQLMSVKK